MKAKFKSFWAFILGQVLALVGVQSCFTVVEYGCPHSDFTVKGTVTDKNSNPVEGIRAIVKTTSLAGTESVKYEFLTDTLYTDTQGKINKVYDTGWSFDNTVIEISLEDVDGPEHGGDFEGKTLSGKPTKTADGKGDWDWGSYSFEFTAEMSAKEKK